MNNTNEDTLKRIACYLMLHGSFTPNIGLLNGKMGIAIFFYHYARHTNKHIYDDFAGELIDEIYKEIHMDSPRDFKDGLSGIAWGIEYLIQNSFIEADTDEVLEELDVQILERDVRKIKDISLETGLKGIAHYVISRCGNRSKPNPYISREYIQDLSIALRSHEKKEDECILLACRLNELNKQVPLGNDLLKSLLNKRKSGKNIRFETVQSLGIANNGLVGVGLDLMWKAG